jgi:hypothetical protein
VRATLVLIALGLISCATQPGVDAQAASIALTPLEAIARAPELKGQTVRLKGYFTARTDTRALWQDRDAWLDADQQRLGSYAEHNYWDKCVTVYSQKPIGIREGNVELEGRLVVVGRNDMRSLWTCNAVSIENARRVG